MQGLKRAKVFFTIIIVMAVTNEMKGEKDKLLELRCQVLKNANSLRETVSSIEQLKLESQRAKLTLTELNTLSKKKTNCYRSVGKMFLYSDEHKVKSWLEGTIDNNRKLIDNLEKKRENQVASLLQSEKEYKNLIDKIKSDV